MLHLVGCILVVGTQGYLAHPQSPIDAAKAACSCLLDAEPLHRCHATAALSARSWIFDLLCPFDLCTHRDAWINRKYRPHMQDRDCSMGSECREEA